MDVKATSQNPMKMTEIGEIPEDWEIGSLGSVLEVRYGKDQKDIRCEYSEIPILGSGGQMGWASTHLYEGPSVLIGRKGTIDHPRYSEGPFWTIDTLFYTHIGPRLDPKFAFYKFWQIPWLQYNEASGVPSLNAQTIESINIALPSDTREQKAIAAALSDADDYISGLKKLADKKRAIKQGAMQELLTGRRRLPGFEGEWGEFELGALLSYEQPTQYIVTNSEYMEAGDVPVLTANQSFLLGFTQEQYGIYTKGRAIIFDDFTTDVKFVDRPFKVKSSAIKILTCKMPNDSLYFFYMLLEGLKRKPEDHQRHWISIYTKKLLVLPSTTERSAIAEALSNMDDEIAALETQLDKAKQIKQAMMKELLTGRIRLV